MARVLVARGWLRELVLENLAPATATGGLEATMPKTPAATRGPPVLDRAVASLAELEEVLAPGEARDRDRLASPRIPPFRGLDFTAPAIGSARNKR